MNTNKTLGIIFANSHDALLGDLTKQRSMASLPFGGRYRLVDFALSNLSNAGIDKVGIITKANYHSLMTKDIVIKKCMRMDKSLSNMKIKV